MRRSSLNSSSCMRRPSPALPPGEMHHRHRILIFVCFLGCSPLFVLFVVAERWRVCVLSWPSSPLPLLSGHASHHPGFTLLASSSLASPSSFVSTFCLSSSSPIPPSFPVSPARQGSSSARRPTSIPSHRPHERNSSLTPSPEAAAASKATGDRPKTGEAANAEDSRVRLWCATDLAGAYPLVRSRGNHRRGRRVADYRRLLHVAGI